MTQKSNRDDHKLSAADEAIHWQARIMSGAMTREERSIFGRWLAASEENREAYAELQSALTFADDNAAELLAEDFEEELHQAADERFPSVNRYIGIAAALVLVCSAIIAGTSLDIFQPQPKLYATHIGEISKVALNDGSLIELDTNSSVEVAFNRSKRSVNLNNGRAVFVVERDIDRPFVVETAQVEIAVTGTMFNVNLSGGDTFIHVISGIVEVLPKASRQLTLLAGDSVKIDANGVSGEIMPFDPTEVLSWRTRMLRYRAASLGDVIADLNRYFDKPITLEDPSLASLIVTGEFDTADQASVLRALALIFSLDSQEEADRIVLSVGESE